MRRIPERRIDIELVFKEQKDKYEAIQKAKVVIGQLVQGLIKPVDVDTFLEDLNGSSHKFLISRNPSLKWMTPMAIIRRNQERKLKENRSD